MKDLIISLAVDGRDKYSERVKGLEASLIHWDGDVRIYKEFPEWCTPHSEIPYAFKYDLIYKAWKDGYRRIFWMDSSMRLLKNPSRLLDEQHDGVVAFHNLGHDLEPYINDTAVHIMGVKNLSEVKQTWGGCFFFDLQKDVAWVMFRRLQEYAERGAFNDDNTTRPGFKAHRHDQACFSWLLHVNNIPLLPYGIIAAKQHITDQTHIQYAD